MSLWRVSNKPTTMQHLFALTNILSSFQLMHDVISGRLIKIELPAASF